MWYTTTLIFKIYRNWDKFEESFDHNMRVGDIQNAMPGLSDRNILLLGSLDDSLADTVMVRIAHDLKSGES
ncbi:MAG: hypothetical protein LBE27_04915, partial [Deltaproteobacteria bacterium]|nr:hypothetical protein [Deltaproteobacteria bacterium]